MEATPPAVSDLRGQTFLITGANAGIGYWCAEQLAARGARVVLGCRSPERAAVAAAAIRQQVPSADLRVLSLDLGSLESIATAASSIDEKIDVVVCNAGVKAADPRARTSDGFDLMMGTNFLGHFALLAHLTPALAANARIVTVGSISHRFAELDPAHIDATWTGSSLRQYARSKAALMSFTFELDRRWAFSDRTVVCAHPGYAVDPLTPERPGAAPVAGFLRALAAPTGLLVQGKDGGALPIVHAATDAEVMGGEYWGPGGMLEFRGAPARVLATDAVRSPEAGAVLWSTAEALTGVTFSA